MFAVTVEHVAYHEAGHAIVALALGSKVRSVSIAPSLTRCAHRRGTPHNAIVALAGNLAEQRGCPGSNFDAFVDLRCALDVAESLQPADPLALLQKFLDQADELLDERWGQVETIAAALLQRQRLTGDEIDALVRP